MGCVSSKLLRRNLKQEFLSGNGDLPNHVVSLTSTTYGVLKLDQDTNNPQQIKQISSVSCSKQKLEGDNVHKVAVFESKRSPEGKKSEGDVHNIAVLESKRALEGKKSEGDVHKIAVFESKRSPPSVELEVINTWELMSDLEDEIPISNQAKKSPKLMGFRGGVLEKDEKRSPFKCLVDRVSSPKGVKKLSGKENKGWSINNNQCYTTPKGVMKPWKFSSNSSHKLRKPSSSMDSPRRSTSSSCGVSSSRRKSLSPLFDPELIDSIEKELCLEEEQIKKMVSPKKTNNNDFSSNSWYSSRNVSKSSSIALEKYELKYPPRGENCVVIYTTSLRGIRKTFEDCNVVRSAIESYHIRVIERDISMDSGFKEELRKLMGSKEVKVPLVFVKGRLIGGADQVIKLDEEGKLEELLQGIPKAVFGCQGCGGLRFVMCMECNGSCKVLDQGTCKSMVRCGECNENGLIQCPVCC